MKAKFLLLNTILILLGIKCYSQDQTINGNLSVSGDIKIDMTTTNKALNFSIGSADNVAAMVKVSRLGAKRWMYGTSGNNGADDFQFFRYSSSGSFLGTPLTILRESGNVGLGVTSPAASLEVARGAAPNGTAAFKGTIRDSYFNFSTNEDTYIRGGKDNSNVYINDNGGNVGIGTVLPDSKLTVAGKIHAQEVKVSIDAGADFVFARDYALRPLSELNSYINLNKHLPEIASASEMEKSGVELGEMNIKLLQKVEELTLYIIGIKNELDSLRQENQKFKELIKNKVN